MMTTIAHPNGTLKARITETRDGWFRVSYLERLDGTFVCEADRSATANWSLLWALSFDAPFHLVCDRVHDHVMASRRDVLSI
jgi:hypothetical protein